MLKPLVVVGMVIILAIGLRGECQTLAQQKKMDAARAKVRAKQAKDEGESEKVYKYLGRGVSPEVGDKGMLFKYYDGVNPGRTGFRVMQIVDDNNVLGLLHICKPGDGIGEDQIVWFNLPTNGMADDKIYLTGEQWFEVTGTKQYTTALEAKKTVLVLKPTFAEVNQEVVDAKKKAAEQKAAAEARRQAEKEKKASEATRTWTSAKSNKTFTATFVGKAGDKIRLKKEDGTVISSDLSLFSEADQEWVKDRSK